LQHLSWCVLSDVAGTVCAARMLPHAAADSLSLCVCCALQLSVSLSRVHLALAAPRSTLSQASECHSVSWPHSRCITVSCKLNSYSNSALSLAHHSPISSPPPASIAARTRHESKSQACGSREVNVRTQQSANACKVSGRAVTSFKSVRVYASMLLRPIGIINFGTRS
jgi:hypothetical protein